MVVTGTEEPLNATSRATATSGFPTLMALLPAAFSVPTIPSTLTRAILHLETRGPPNALGVFLTSSPRAPPLA